MQEEFLHYIWRTKQFRQENLRTTDGSSVEILDHGRQNVFSGPDFSNSTIAVGGMLWTGNVEIHIRSSDWDKHRHQEDPAYNNVILHVVYEHDKAVKKQNGEELPTFELKKKIPHTLFRSYDALMNEKRPIPCGRQSNGSENTPMIERTIMADRLLMDRLSRRSEELQQVLNQCTGDWEELFYRVVLTTMGMPLNADPFRWLGNIVPFRLVQKYSDDLFRLEALFFGQAGMLSKQDEPYVAHLQREYMHLQHTHGLIPMDASAWKFMRLRPNNFPSLRIAQAAALFHKRGKLFRSCMDENNAEMLAGLFNASASEYWDSNYRFGVPSRVQTKQLGKKMTDVLLINAIAPVKFLYGKMKKEERYCEDALSLLEQISGEDNSVVQQFSSAGWNIKNAAVSQGLLELKRNYCDRKKCLECEVGMKVLGRSKITQVSTSG